MKNYILFLALILGLSNSLQATPLNSQLDQFPDLHNTNKETLYFLKNELTIARNVLLEIRDNANPGAVASLGKILSTLFKEALYIGVSGVIVVAPIAGLDQGLGWQLLNNPVTLGFTASGVAIGMVITYTLIKLIFGKLLASDTNSLNRNVKESLVQIDYTLNRISFAIDRIERISTTL